MNNKIPKTIHYCWFGDKPLPKLANSIVPYLPQPTNTSSNSSGNDAIDAATSIFKMFNK